VNDSAEVVLEKLLGLVLRLEVSSEGEAESGMVGCPREDAWAFFSSLAEVVFNYTGLLFAWDDPDEV